MKVTINGNLEEISANKNIIDVLNDKGIDNIAGIAVEYNGNILDKGLWNKTILKEGDEVEYIYFIGGGK